MLSDPPTSLDTREEWQAVSEVSFEATSADACIRLLMNTTAPPFDFFSLPDGPGWYRARAHAVGRGLDFDVVVRENPREKHLIQMWRVEGGTPEQHHRIDNRWAGQRQRT